MNVAVVGSGPAALATIISLLTESEYQITIFDDASKLKSGQESAKGAKKANERGLQKRLRLDTSVDVSFYWNGKERNLIPSNQISGGWSNLWGATVLLNNHLNPSDVEAHFQSSSWMTLLKYLPVQGEADSLEQRFPLLGNETRHGEISGLAESLLSGFMNRLGNDRSIVFGKSRLAINPLNDDINFGCISCSNCLRGCPNNHVFNSWTAIQKLQKVFGPGRLIFSGNGGVARFHEDNLGRIFIETADGEIYENFKKIYIAAGAVGTAALLLRSLGLNRIAVHETPMTIIPSFYFGRRSAKSTGVSLSEVFMSQYEKDKVSSAGQIYSFNNELLDIIFRKFKINWLKSLLPKIIQSRVVFCMFFIPPNVNSDFEVRVTSKTTRVDFNGKYTYREFKPELVKFARKMRSLGFLTIPILSYRPPKGSSFHYGSLHLKHLKNSLLVRKNGTLNLLATDSNVFCVGSSGFDSLIPGPITLDIMLHSQLVANQSSLIDRK